MSIQTQSLPRQGTLPFKRRSKGQTVAVSESVIEAQTDYHLRADGAEVLSTVHRYKLQTCPACGHKFRPKGGYGATPGVPDRLARLLHWPLGLWLGLELKGSKTVLSPDQKRLRADGAIVVCRSGVEASAALADADETLGLIERLKEAIWALCDAIRARNYRACVQAAMGAEALAGAKTS